MSRAKYSEEARNAIMASFVKATKDLIASEGMDAISIRRVSAAAGYSSATLYLYFDDINELVTMSLISSLDAYIRDIIETTPDDETPRAEYLRTWQISCRHAFADPATYLDLFYGPRSRDLDVIAQKYYELFPEELGQANKRMLNMLAGGSLSRRNFAVLDSFAGELGLSEGEAKLANDLTIAYFRSFLEQVRDAEPSPAEIDELTSRFMRGALFVLRDTADA